MSYSEMARHLKVGKNTVSRWARGVNQIPHMAVMLIEQMLSEPERYAKKVSGKPEAAETDKENVKLDTAERGAEHAEGETAQ
jgi:transcriptional regulator with XRE-family HTH domain